MQAYVLQKKKENKSVGFVPTMGALHQGHITLVTQCRLENEVCVVSVFVNPTQFNNPEDLTNYPRTFEADCAMLQLAGVDVVFAPSVGEMYPEEDKRSFNFGALEHVMEGAHRPGHFNGVAQVVSKLFAMVMPDRSYFGEKDFQQLAIIKEMVKQLELPVQVIPCAIVREADGLAMSSRNTRLTPAQRRVVPLIHQVLAQSKTGLATQSVEEVKQWVIDKINKEPLLEVEYFEIADALTLQSVVSWEQSGNKVGFVAVHVGDVRLIDNVLY